MIERKEYMNLLEKWRKQEDHQGSNRHTTLWQVIAAEDV